LRDLIAPAAILGIAKPGMVGIELNNIVPIRNGFIRDQSPVDVIE
jgi:hypothetical protein